MEPELVARRERLETRVCDLTVRDDHDGSVERANPRGPQPDVIDRAQNVAHLQGVSNTHRLIED